jgi:hypothetical protein
MTFAESQTDTTAAGLSLERWSATSGSDRASRATLVLSGGGHRWRAHAEGNGAVDALMRAVDQALSPLLDAGVVLTSYDVHATGQGHETRASVSVSVRERNADGPLYPGRALHENVLEASVTAYVDAINRLLVDQGVEVSAAVPAPGDTTRHDTTPDEQVRAGTKDHIMSAYNG